MNRRGSGIFLHITSLPSLFGIGDLGPWAYRFVDFLAQARQVYWQILPLNPTEPAFGNSPYHSLSAFAFNTLLISPKLMVQEGRLDESDIVPQRQISQKRVDYRAVLSYKKKLFRAAYEHFKKKREREEYEKFCLVNSSWLDDFALFIVLKNRFKKQVWSDWPDEIRDRKAAVLSSLKKKLHDDMEKEKFLQYIFMQQWLALRNYCQQKNVRIIGDIPIYVNYDSSDVWINPQLFKLDEKKKPFAVAGVPPDYFSATGQLWGNPLYRWDILKDRDYEWWMQRVEHNLRLFDIVRIDHFRGFVGYWEVPATESKAINGHWREAPAVDFFTLLKKKFPQLPIIAEDLGTITPDVEEVMTRFAFPGMKVLLFAFGEDNSMHPYLPHTYERDCVVYTGTHDNNTVRGWFEREARAEDKARLFRYLGRKVSRREIHLAFIRLAMQSVANTLIIPMQDVLGLGEKTRMNRPASSKGNWEWRLLPHQMTTHQAEQLSELTEIYGRV